MTLSCAHVMSKIQRVNDFAKRECELFVGRYLWLWLKDTELYFELYFDILEDAYARLKIRSLLFTSASVHSFAKHAFKLYIFSSRDPIIKRFLYSPLFYYNFSVWPLPLETKIFFRYYSQYSVFTLSVVSTVLQPFLNIPIPENFKFSVTTGARKREKERLISI